MAANVSAYNVYLLYKSIFLLALLSSAIIPKLLTWVQTREQFFLRTNISHDLQAK